MEQELFLDGSGVLVQCSSWLAESALIYSQSYKTFFFVINVLNKFLV
jgi:hypothetical protein